MSRGRASEQAFAAAVAVARARGQVVFVRAWPTSACDFLLLTPYGIVAVCVRRTRRIRAEPEEIVRDYRETLNRIRANGHCAGISTEFWLWCPYGTMRFFLLEGFTLVEISIFGLPLVPSVTGEIAGRSKKYQGASGSPEKKPAEPYGNNSVPGEKPGTLAGKNSSLNHFPGAFGQDNPAPNFSGRSRPRELPYLRYLRRRNAEIPEKSGEVAQRRSSDPAHSQISAREPLPPPGKPPPGTISAPDHSSPRFFSAGFAFSSAGFSKQG